MAQYRKKPIVIEAEVYMEGMEDGFIANLDDYGCRTWEALERKGIYFDDIKRPYINTLGGNILITEGDWIITGIQGERYPCKPDIFEATYEEIEE